MNFYKRHIGDYLKDTAHLSLLEHGIYSRLLDVYYTREGSIPDDAVARLIGARTKEETRALKTVLAEFFELLDGTWHQSRCEQEISAANDKADKNREVGKLGGRPRKTETKQVIKNNHDGFESEPTDNPSQTPDSRLQTPDQNLSPANAGDPVIQKEALTPKNKTTALVKTTVGETELQSACRETWAAYSNAYAKRYNAIPVRNVRVNSQIRQFIGCVSREEAPQVAAFYVTNNAAFYVKQMHSVGMLLKDAEKLRTEWATNRRVTDTEARQADKTQAIGGVFQELIEEARERRATAA